MLFQLSFFKLPKLEKKLVLRAVFLFYYYWVLVRTRPLESFEKKSFPPWPNLPFPIPDRARTEYLVKMVSKYFPGVDNCLLRALVSRELLGRLGVEVQLKVGAKKEENGDVGAHAWVE